jgi:hypothetical protein
MHDSIDVSFFVVQNRGMRTRITSSARKHALTATRIQAAMSNATSIETIESETTDPKIRWIGADDRGEELEVVAVVLPDLLLVIHAMPTRYRGRSR